MTYCSVVAVPALVGLAKKRFDHYAILNCSETLRKEECTSKKSIFLSFQTE